MKHGEYKEINGMFARKEGHPVHRNRDGYAKACYAIYGSIEQMKTSRPVFRCYTMPEVRELTKRYMSE